MQQQDTTHSIMQSAKRFFSGTMLSRVTGLFRDVSMAYAFGTQEAVAAFLVAFRFAHLLRRLLGEGALQTAFIPQFEALRAKDQKSALSFFQSLTFYLSSGLFLLIALIMVALAVTWKWGQLSVGNTEIIGLTFLMMPSLLFICLFGLNAALLQCEKRFFITGVAPVAFNVIWTLGVIVLWNFSAAVAMPWLALCIILACMFQWIVTLPSTQTVFRKENVPFWKLPIDRSDAKIIIKPLLLAIMGVAATQINNAVDSLFARYAESEGPAYLWYALRLQQLPLALFGIAIAGALLPPLTRAIKNNDWVRYRLFLQFSLKRSIALMLPVTAVLFCMGSSCINLLYGHGDFEFSSIVGTTHCLWGYTVGLFPMSLVLILAPAFYAQGEPRIPAVISVVSVALNIGLNIGMIAGLGLGATSVAIATSISAWANMLLLFYFLPSCREILNTQVWVSMGKVFASTTLATLAVVAVDLWVFPHQNLWQGSFNLTRDFYQQLYQCIVEGAAFISILGLSALLLRTDDMIQLIFYRKESKDAKSAKGFI